MSSLFYQRKYQFWCLKSWNRLCKINLINRLYPLYYSIGIMGSLSHVPHHQCFHSIRMWHLVILSYRQVPFQIISKYHSQKSLSQHLNILQKKPTWNKAVRRSVWAFHLHGISDFSSATELGSHSMHFSPTFCTFWYSDHNNSILGEHFGKHRWKIITSCILTATEQRYAASLAFLSCISNPALVFEQKKIDTFKNLVSSRLYL